MSIKQRGDRTYYYAAERVGGKVRTRYVAAGERAVEYAELQTEIFRLARLQGEELALLKELDAENDRQYRARLAEARRAIAEAEGPVAEFFGRVEAVFRAAMEAAGYRRSWRKWRKARETMGGDTVGETTKPKRAAKGRKGKPTTKVVPVAERDRETLEADLTRHVAAADAGDPEKFERFRHALEADRPATVGLLRGDPAANLERGLIERLARTPTARLAMQAHVAAMKADLLGPEPTALEALMVGRIVTSWLAAQDADARVIEATTYQLDDEGEMTFEYSPAEFWTGMQDRAHKRLNAAIKTLAVARRLALPNLNVLQLGLVSGGGEPRESRAIDCEPAAGQLPGPGGTPTLLELEGDGAGDPGPFPIRLARGG